MNYSYKDTYKLMRKFRSLSKSEVAIIDYLLDKTIVDTTYSGITKAIGQKDTSNVRKALLDLEEIGLVSICRKWDEEELKPEGAVNNPMVACFIKDDWLQSLLDKSM